MTKVQRSRPTKCRMPSPWSRTKYVSSALHARSPTCTIASRQTQLANISVAHGLVSFARIRRIPDSNQQPRTKTSAAWRGPRWLRLNAKIETEAIAFLLVSYAVFCWLPLPLFFFLSLSLSLIRTSLQTWLSCVNFACGGSTKVTPSRREHALLSYQITCPKGNAASKQPCGWFLPFACAHPMGHSLPAWLLNPCPLSPRPSIWPLLCAWPGLLPTPDPYRQ